MFNNRYGHSLWNEEGPTLAKEVLSLLDPAGNNRWARSTRELAIPCLEREVNKHGSNRTGQSTKETFCADISVEYERPENRHFPPDI